MKTTNTVKLDRVHKKFKHKKVIENFSYEFQPGNIYLLTGENGCGKSTLLRIIGKYITPTKGKIYNNLIIGYAPDKVMIPSYLSVKQYLTLLSEIRSKKSINLDNFDRMEDIDTFQLRKYIDEKVNILSKGTFQKINILQTFLHNPDLYLYDEPLSGLDQKMQEVFVAKIKKLKEQGKIIIIATHYIKSYSKTGAIEIKIGEKND